MKTKTLADFKICISAPLRYINHLKKFELGLNPLLRNVVKWSDYGCSNVAKLFEKKIIFLRKKYV